MRSLAVSGKERGRPALGNLSQLARELSLNSPVRTVIEASSKNTFSPQGLVEEHPLQ